MRLDPLARRQVHLLRRTLTAALVCLLSACASGLQHGAAPGGTPRVVERDLSSSPVAVSERSTPAQRP